MLINSLYCDNDGMTNLSNIDDYIHEDLYDTCNIAKIIYSLADFLNDDLRTRSGKIAPTIQDKILLNTNTSEYDDTIYTFYYMDLQIRFFNIKSKDENKCFYVNSYRGTPDRYIVSMYIDKSNLNVNSQLSIYTLLTNYLIDRYLNNKFGIKPINNIDSIDRYTNSKFGIKSNSNIILSKEITIQNIILFIDYFNCLFNYTQMFCAIKDYEKFVDSFDNNILNFKLVNDCWLKYFNFNNFLKDIFDISFDSELSEYDYISLASSIFDLSN